MAKPPRTSSPATDRPAAPPGYGHAAHRATLRDAFVHTDADRLRLKRDARHDDPHVPVDWLFVADPDAATPAQLFHRLRWGGQAVVAAKTPRHAEELLRLFRSRDEWRLDEDPRPIEYGKPRWWQPWKQTTATAFVVRKVLLELPENPTLRHSYDVRLEPWPGVANGYCVQKRIPMPDQIRRRLLANLSLQQRPDDAGLERMIKKLRTKVFPLFLTREAGFLKILQRDLPEKYRAFVPDVLDLEYGDKGYVCTLRSRWLRLGGEPISPMTFAQHAAEIVQQIHEAVGVVHLDLRLDNFLITEQGVKVVDFGSAVRQGEDITSSAILTKLFTEMLSASQIRRDLMRMIDKGRITSSAFVGAYSPPGPAADLFSVVNNFGRLGEHPDFRGLVRPNPTQEATLNRIRREVFRPADIDAPGVVRIHDLLRRLLDPADRPRSVPLRDGAVRIDIPHEPSAESRLELDAFADTAVPSDEIAASQPSLPFSLAVPAADED